MKQRMRADERRESILDTAIQLFSDRGFRGATTREIAEAVGVTEPVLYQHFKNKSDLYQAILERKSMESLAYVESYFGSLPEDPDDTEVLSVLGNMILRKYLEDPFFIRLLLFSALERHEASSAFFNNQVASLYEVVAGYFRRRMERGAFRQIEPALAARIFLGSVANHGLTQVLFQDTIVPSPPDLVVAEIVATFLKGIETGRRQGA